MYRFIMYNDINKISSHISKIIFIVILNNILKIKINSFLCNKIH